MLDFMVFFQCEYEFNTVISKDRKMNISNVNTGDEKQKAMPSQEVAQSRV